MKHYCITTTQVYEYKEDEMPMDDYRIDRNVQEQYISCKNFIAMKNLLKMIFNKLIEMYESIDFKEYTVMYKNFNKTKGPVGFDISINDPVFGKTTMNVYVVETV